MQLMPRYGTDPVIVLDGPPGAVGGAAVRQRRRLAEVLAGFDDEQWSHPSRCEGWTNRDVIVHLDTTNMFWAFSITAGLGGAPSQFLATFDPVATPAQLVAGAGEIAPDALLERFVASSEGLADLLDPLDEAGWSTLAEAPPGHVTVDALVHHALWDSWIHERDVLVPLGVEPVEEPDEIEAALRYAAGLGPAFSLTRGTEGTGRLAIETTGPELHVAVDIGGCAQVHGDTSSADLCLRGDAVELLEVLSVRAPLTQEVAPASAWMLGGLRESFDQA